MVGGIFAQGVLLIEVHTGAVHSVLWVRGSKDYSANTRVTGECIQRVGEVCGHGIGESIASFGTVKLDDYDGGDFFGGFRMVKELEGWKVKGGVTIGE
jgi:hypothetical protein